MLLIQRTNKSLKNLEINLKISQVLLMVKEYKFTSS